MAICVFGHVTSSSRLHGCVSAGKNLRPRVCLSPERPPPAVPPGALCGSAGTIHRQVALATRSLCSGLRSQAAAGLVFEWGHGLGSPTGCGCWLDSTFRLGGARDYAWQSDGVPVCAPWSRGARGSAQQLGRAAGLVRGPSGLYNVLPGCQASVAMLPRGARQEAVLRSQAGW